MGGQSSGVYVKPRLSLYWVDVYLHNVRKETKKSSIGFTFQSKPLLVLSAFNVSRCGSWQFSALLFIVITGRVG